MSEIGLSKFSQNLANHGVVQNIVDQFVSSAVVYFKVKVELPTSVVNTSPDELFIKAAVLRSNLDSLSTIQSGLLIVRLQVKNAKVIAEGGYRSALTTVYRQGQPEILKARSSEERELLARSFIDPIVVQEFQFWSAALENVDDTVNVIGTKMRMFKGGLDTILTMLGLIKVSAQLRGITLNSGHLEKLLENQQVTSAQEEGEYNLGS